MNSSRQTVFITGGSTGIGLAIAMRLAAQHHRVCIFARDPLKLNKAQNTIRAAGGDCYSYSVDATDMDAVLHTMDYAVNEAGVPDILINCVGRAIPHRFESITSNMFMETMQANVGSAWHIIQAVLPYMKENGGGRIINTSSVGGFIGVYGYTDYSASKFALIGFSESLRQELKPHNICVQVLCPPDTDTPGLALENRTKPEETRRISESAGLMNADEVAAYTIRAMQRDDFMIIPGWDSKLTWILKRFFPALTYKLLDRVISKVQKEKAPQPVYGHYRGHLARA